MYGLVIIFCFKKLFSFVIYVILLKYVRLKIKVIKIINNQNYEINFINYKKNIFLIIIKNYK